MSVEHFDVVVVGLGPVGAAVANLLGGHGVRTLVVEQATEINRAPRAIALDNEALRVLRLAGLAEGAFDTVAIPFVQMRSPIFGAYARANTTGQIDGHPKLVTFFQPQLEEALRARLAGRASVEVRTGVEVTQLHDGADAAWLELRAGHERSRVAARFVVGCDGASSFVRKAVGVELTGRTFAEDWLVVDVRGAPQPIDHVEFCCDPKRPSPHMPAPDGRQRWEFKLRRGETREQMERPEVVHALLRPWTRGAPVELERVAVYRFHARIAERFSVGRVFLAGDAAHLTPPFAGQGLVSGLRDAANLAWKIAAVIQGCASSSILDSYHVERRPHAARTIDMALLMGRMVMPRNWLAGLVVHGIAYALDKFPATRRLFRELEIKPVHGSRTGLFRKRRGDRLRPGTTFPQALVAHAGTVVPSDDVVAGLCLVGFGVDPATALDDDTAARWRAAGGRIVQIAHRGQRASAAVSCEDVTGRFLGAAESLGWAAVVRPDRITMCEGPARDSARLVEQALQVLDAPRATDAARKEMPWTSRRASNLATTLP